MGRMEGSGHYSTVRKPAYIFEMAVRRFFQDRLTTSAAAIAFYSLFSGFPLLLLAVITSTLFMEPREAAGRVEGMLREYVPIGSRLIEESLMGAVRAGGATFGLSIVALMWSGTRVFAHTIRALNHAWNVEHNYPIRTRLVIYPLLVVLTVAIIAFGMLNGTLLAPMLTAFLGEAEGTESSAWHLVGEALQEVLGLAILLLLYRYMPRGNTTWRDALPGALLAMLLSHASQEAFLYYTHRFGDRYTAVYGSLHDIAVLLLWAYISAVIFLFGAEFGSAYRSVRSGQVRREDARLVNGLEEARL